MLKGGGVADLFLLVNPGGLITQLPLIVRDRPKYIAVFESQATEAIMRQANTILQQVGYSATWGLPKEAWRPQGFSAGIALFTLGQAARVIAPDDPILQTMWLAVRYMHVAFAISGPNQWMHVHIVYCDVREIGVDAAVQDPAPVAFGCPL